jgi:hypothetical protein
MNEGSSSADRYLVKVMPLHKHEAVGISAICLTVGQEPAPWGAPYLAYELPAILILSRHWNA